VTGRAAPSILYAGAAVADITPTTSQFLYGYPHVRRFSTGVHDPLLSSALCLKNGDTTILFIANDIIWVPRPMVQGVRRIIRKRTGIPESNILISATHTHSGPITLKMISNESDSAVPDPDPEYLKQLQEKLIAAGVHAHANLEPAEIGLSTADGSAVGTNRRDSKGPADPNVPVMLVRSIHTNKPLACMLVCSMHPTVLHEDSTLISGDFPGMTRQYLQQTLVGKDCPVLHHTGPAGNQSPRHVTRSNTFEEAKRLGELLGKSIAGAILNIRFSSNLDLRVRQDFLSLPRRTFPSVEEASVRLKNAWETLQRLRNQNAAPGQIRTAEVDWFGAEETLTLAQAEADRRLDRAAAECMPAEIQILSAGPWNFAGWNGEIFIEYALQVKQRSPDTFVISLANGELQGYIVTEEAAREGGYEASNAMFSHESGALFVKKTLQMLGVNPS